MIERIIEASARNRLLVFIVVGFAAFWGVWSLRNVPLDAIPDLSDVQVIVFTEWPGRSPDLVEDQITYPVITTMLSVSSLCVASRSSGCPSSTSSSRTAPICTGPAVGCWNTSTK